MGRPVRRMLCLASVCFAAAQADARFEVAAIKPSAPGSPDMMVREIAGVRMRIEGFPLTVRLTSYP